MGRNVFEFGCQRSNIIVEFDLDGVLLDIYTAMESLYYRHTGKTICFESDVSNWGMSDLEPSVRSDIFKLFGNPVLFSSVTAYQDAYLFLHNVLKLIHNGTIVLHTYVPNDACSEARRRSPAVNRLIGTICSAGARCILCIDTDGSKQGLKGLTPLVALDDNASYLSDSCKVRHCGVKFLYSQFHNKHVQNPMLHRVNGYTEAYQAMRDVMEGTHV